MKSFIVMLALGLSAAKPSPSVWEMRPPPSLVEKRPPPSLQDKRPPTSLVNKRPPPSLQDKRPPPSLVEKRPAPSLVEKRPPPSLQDKRPPPSLVNKRPPPSLQDKRPPQSLQQVIALSPASIDGTLAQSRLTLPCGAHSLSVGSYIIMSPNHPSNYGNNFDCTYSLSPAAGVTALSISCSAFNLENHSSCGWDWLRVNGNKFCGTSGPSVTSSALNVNFHTDYSVVRTGFRCTITATSPLLSCGSHALTAGTYTIASPNHPANYDNNYDCTYALTGSSGVTSLAISCSAFNLENHSSCGWDWLRVNGNKFCGTSGPSVTSSALSVNFHTDYSVVRTGFLCTIVARGGSCSCGEANRAARIVGGQETGVNEYPWQAGLVSPGQTRTWCGGSLINDRYVMTAAHCTNGQVASQIQVLLGDHRIGVSDGETRHTLAQIIQDPLYTSVANGHDYSLLKLSAPVTFNTRRLPVCLPTAGNTYAGASAIATGFGRTGATDPQATTLLEVVLPVRPDSVCSSYWTVRSTTICAGGLPQGGKAVCRGDSGGPLITLENGKYALIGVVSYGRACAHANVPDMFARVTAALSWIQANTADATYCT